jgi:MbtH protein
MFQDFPDNTNDKVVINHEEQYSIWPTSKTTPTGWKDVGRTGSKRTCQACRTKP